MRRQRIPPDLIQKAREVMPDMPVEDVFSLALEISLERERMDPRRKETLRRILRALLGQEDPSHVPARTRSRRYPEVLAHVRDGLRCLGEGAHGPIPEIPPPSSSGSPAGNGSMLRRQLENLLRRAIRPAQLNQPLSVRRTLSPWGEALDRGIRSEDARSRILGLDLWLLAEAAAVSVGMLDLAGQVASRIRTHLPSIPERERKVRERALAFLEGLRIYRMLAFMPPSRAEQTLRRWQADLEDIPEELSWKSWMRAWIGLRSLAFVPNDALRERLEGCFGAWSCHSNPHLRLEALTGLLRLYMDQEALLVLTLPPRRGRPRQRDAREAARQIEALLEGDEVLGAFQRTRAAIALAVEAWLREDPRKAQARLDEAAQLAEQRLDFYHLQQICHLRACLFPAPDPLPDVMEMGFWQDEPDFWPVSPLHIVVVTIYSDS